MGQRRQFINQVEADDNADGSNDRKNRAAEFPAEFPDGFAAHGDDTDEVDQEYCQRTGVDNSTMCIKGTKPEMMAMTIEPTMVIRYGVWYVS